MKHPFNILIAGVGGQGNLVAGNILAHAAIISGYRVTIGQVFGASRRGGSVFTHIRIWNEDVSPLIPMGHVDIILGLEPLETLRAAHELGSKRTRIIMSKTIVPTIDTMAGRLEYPTIESIEEVLNELCDSVVIVNPTETLERLNASRDLNIYMIGVLCKIQGLPFEENALEQGVREIIKRPERSLDVFREATTVLSP